MFLIWGHAHLLGDGWRARIDQVRRRLADQLLGYRRANAYRLNREKCEAIAEQLIRFRPHGLIGYAAAIDLFARYTRAYRERFHALSLGFVLVTTEAPPRADTREQLEDLFGCPVVEEYGGGEFGQVAFKRGDEPFHVYGDLNYLECESAEPAGGAGYPALLTCLLRPLHAARALPGWRQCVRPSNDAARSRLLIRPDRGKTHRHGGDSRWRCHPQSLDFSLCARGNGRLQRADATA